MNHRRYKLIGAISPTVQPPVQLRRHGRRVASFSYWASIGDDSLVCLAGDVSSNINRRLVSVLYRRRVIGHCYAFCMGDDAPVLMEFLISNSRMPRTPLSGRFSLLSAQVSQPSAARWPTARHPRLCGRAVALSALSTGRWPLSAQRSAFRAKLSLDVLREQFESNQAVYLPPELITHRKDIIIGETNKK